MFDGPYTLDMYQKLCEVVGVDQNGLISLRVWEGQLEVKVPGKEHAEVVTHSFWLDRTPAHDASCAGRVAE